MVGQIGIQDAQNNDVVAFIQPDVTRVRLEIDEFLGDNEMTNLYLLALVEMFKEDRTRKGETEDWWTFYSLSAVHGQPAELWDGVKQKTSVTPAQGYCTHGMLTFPTWHRVYIGMFEQAVANKVQAIAKRFTSEPEKRLYQSAADRFRLPFWDPVLPRNRVARSNRVDERIWGIPQILGATHVWVTQPGSKTPVQIENPLFSFNFPTEDLRRKGRTIINWRPNWQVPAQGEKQTVRSPDSTGNSNIYGESPSQSRAGLNLKIQRQAVQMSTKLWKLLSRYSNEHNNEIRSWGAFATHWVYDEKTGRPIVDANGNLVYEEETSVSLETWHDDIHGLVGSGNPYRGHMSNPAIAGFDPIFWLHHCNIDRILAIYQALYPDKWLPTTGGQQGTTKLYPFRNNSTPEDFWSSNDVRDWKNLGFAIPGNKDLDEQGIRNLEQHLNEYYNWSTEGTFPPPSVSANWPRDLSSSIALNGPRARPAPRSVVQFEALSNKGLVTRSLAVQAPLQVGATIKPTVEDQPKQLAAIPTPNEIPKLYPPGTVQGGGEKQLTWNARVRVQKFAFDGSFNIHLFIGEVDDDQTDRFLTKKNEVGFTGIFASSSDAPCANCVKQREEGFIYEDAIPITHSLYAYLKSNNAPEAEGPKLELRTLESFKPEHVVPFLKKNLQWRVTDTASQLIGEDQQLMDSQLEIRVSAREFELPSPEHPLGVYYPSTVYQDITREKVGGHGFAV